MVTAMTFAKTTTKDNPATPVNSAIWIIGQLAWRATPSPFQPNPLKSQPRIHSCTTHALADKNAVRRLLNDPINVRGRIKPTTQLQNAKYIPR